MTPGQLALRIVVKYEKEGIQDEAYFKIPSTVQKICDLTEAIVTQFHLDYKPNDVGLRMNGRWLVDTNDADILFLDDVVSVEKKTPSNPGKRPMKEVIPHDYPNKKIKTPPKDDINFSPPENTPQASTPPIENSQPRAPTSTGMPPHMAAVPVVPAGLPRFRSVPSPLNRPSHRASLPSSSAAVPPASSSPRPPAQPQPPAALPMLRFKPVPLPIADPYAEHDVAGNFEENNYNYLPDPPPALIPQHPSVTRPSPHTPLAIPDPASSSTLPPVPRSKRPPVFRSQPQAQENPVKRTETIIKSSFPAASEEPAAITIPRPGNNQASSSAPIVASASGKPARAGGVFQPASKDKNSSIYGGTRIPPRTGTGKPKESDRNGNGKAYKPTPQKPAEVSKRPSFATFQPPSRPKPNENGSHVIDLDGNKATVSAAAKVSVPAKSKTPFISIAQRKSSAAVPKRTPVVRTKQKTRDETKRRVSSDRNEPVSKPSTPPRVTIPQSDDKKKRPANESTEKKSSGVVGAINKSPQRKNPFLAGSKEKKSSPVKKDLIAVGNKEKKIPSKPKNPWLTCNNEKKTAVVRKAAVPPGKSGKNTPPLARKEEVSEGSSPGKATPRVRTDAKAAVNSVLQHRISAETRKVPVKLNAQESKAEVRKSDLGDMDEENRSDELKKTEDSYASEDGMIMNVEKDGVCTIVQYMKDNRQKWGSKARCPVRMRLLVEKEVAGMGMTRVPREAFQFAVASKLSDTNELKVIGYDENSLKVFMEMGRGAKQRNSGKASGVFGKDMVPKKKVYVDPKMVFSFSFHTLGDENGNAAKTKGNLVANSQGAPEKLGGAVTVREKKKIGKKKLVKLCDARPRRENTDLRKERESLASAPSKQVPKVRIKISKPMTQKLGLQNKQDAKKKLLEAKKEEAKRELQEEEEKNGSLGIVEMDRDFNGFMRKLVSRVASTVSVIAAREGIVPVQVENPQA